MSNDISRSSDRSNRSNVSYISNIYNNNINEINEQRNKYLKDDFNSNHNHIMQYKTMILTNKLSTNNQFLHLSIPINNTMSNSIFENKQFILKSMSNFPVKNSAFGADFDSKNFIEKVVPNRTVVIQNKRPMNLKKRNDVLPINKARLPFSSWMGNGTI